MKLDLSELKLEGMSHYLRTFFGEKNLPFVRWAIKANDGMEHDIDNGVVLEFIAIAPEHEQVGIGNMIRRIDFANGDVNHYLRHLAGALVNSY